jgi:hypothetical protein
MKRAFLETFGKLSPCLVSISKHAGFLGVESRPDQCTRGRLSRAGRRVSVRVADDGHRQIWSTSATDNSTDVIGLVS